MRVNSNSSRVTELIVPVVLFLVLLGACYLLVSGLRGHGWGLAIAGLLIEAVYLHIGWLIGEGTWVDK